MEGLGVSASTSADKKPATPEGVAGCKFLALPLINAG
jgi:hypothetical protein